MVFMLPFYFIILAVLWCEQKMSAPIYYAPESVPQLEFKLEFGLEDSEIFKEFIEFLKEKEGFRKTRYVCAGGKVTIGFGVTNAGLEEAKRYGFLDEDYKMPKNISEKEAEKLLVESIIPAFTAMVREKLNKRLPDHKELALVSFSYNLGRANLNNIIKDINKGKDPTDRMKLYVYANKKKLRGLETRREKEVEFWNRES